MIRIQSLCSDLDRSKIQTKKNQDFYKQNPESSFDEKTPVFQSKRNFIRKSDGLENFQRKTADELIKDTLVLLSHFYGQEKSVFYLKVKEYLKGQILKDKKKFSEHLNKLSYLEAESQKQNYNEIELQIIAQWRRNPLLHGIRKIWYQFIKMSVNTSVQDFISKYQTFKNFVGQLAFAFFRRFFMTFQGSKENNMILEKLTIRTSHMIITHTRSWSQLYRQIVSPLIQRQKSYQNNKIQFSNPKQVLQKLGIETFIVDINEQNNQMPKTTSSIKRFLSESKILSKISFLHEIRKNLEQQILDRQNYLIKKGVLNGIKLLDKDDLIDCLIYCVVKGSIDVAKLGCEIEYLSVIFEESLDEVLGKFKCQSYFADLCGVFEFLFNFQ